MTPKERVLARIPKAFVRTIERANLTGYVILSPTNVDRVFNVWAITGPFKTTEDAVWAEADEVSAKLDSRISIEPVVSGLQLKTPSGLS